MPTRVTSWINEVNTTSLRIIVSVGVAAFGTLMILAAVLFFRWEPKDIQVKVLLGLGVGVMTMMGLDVAQFIGKRFSDAGYAAAKASPAVNVGGPSTVIAPTTAAPIVGEKVEGAERPQFLPEGIR